jgi:hypothetical protein
MVAIRKTGSTGIECGQTRYGGLLACLLAAFGVSDSTAKGCLFFTAILTGFASAVVLAWPYAVPRVLEFNRRRIARGQRPIMLEPIHIITIGLAIAAVGAGWQWYRGNAAQATIEIPKTLSQYEKYDFNNALDGITKQLHERITTSVNMATDSIDSIIEDVKGNKNNSGKYTGKMNGIKSNL